MQDYGETSKFYKELVEEPTYDIGVLDDKGTETKPGTKTIKHLYHTHFPTHTKPRKPVINHFKQIETSKLQYLYKDLITPSKIKKH